LIFISIWLYNLGRWLSPKEIILARSRHMERVRSGIWWYVILHLPFIGAQQYRVVAYYTSWTIYAQPGIESFKPKDIQGELLTHVSYAFAKPYTSDKGHKVTSYEVSLTDPWADTDYDASSSQPGGNFGQLLKLKKQYPHLKTLLSIGGWSIWQEGMPKEKFAHLAADPKLRSEFIKSAIALAILHEFEGIDIDWEYPEPGQATDFTLLLEELHHAAKDATALNAIRKQWGKQQSTDTLLVTIAAPATGQRNNLNIKEAHRFLDWINLMTYDYHGAWSGSVETNNNAPLPLVKETVDYYLGQGVPAGKLVLGMALYGRSFAGVAPEPVNSKNPGLFHSFKGPGPSTNPEEPGMILYHTIYDRYLTKSTGFKMYWDSEGQVPYLYNESTGDLISYDNARSLTAKSDLVKQKKLGGIMFWPLAREKSHWALIDTARHALTT
jgi:chitinase